MILKACLAVYLVFSCTSSTAQDTLGRYSIAGYLLSRNNAVAIDFGEMILVDNTTGKKQTVYCMYDGAFGVGNLNRGTYTLQVYSSVNHFYDTTFQLNGSLDSMIVYAVVKCKYGTEKAKSDILTKHPKLFIPGGIAPVIYSDQHIFERKYGIEYYQTGCIMVDIEDCLISYNKTVFEYLDSMYGKKWRKSVRQDTKGLE